MIKSDSLPDRGVGQLTAMSFFGLEEVKSSQGVKLGKRRKWAVWRRCRVLSLDLRKDCSCKLNLCILYGCLSACFVMNVVFLVGTGLPQKK